MIDIKQSVEGFDKMIKDKGPWDIFLVTTFRQEKEAEGAKRCFKCKFKYLNEPDDVYYEKVIYAFIVLERNEHRGGIHIHAFIRGIDPSLALFLEDKLKSKRCRKDKCAQDNWYEPKYKSVIGETVALPYDSKKGGSWYLSWKYPFAKIIDFDFIKINSRYRGFRPCHGLGEKSVTCRSSTSPSSSSSRHKATKARS